MGGVQTDRMTLDSGSEGRPPRSRSDAAADRGRSWIRIVVPLLVLLVGAGAISISQSPWGRVGIPCGDSSMTGCWTSVPWLFAGMALVIIGGPLFAREAAREIDWRRHGLRR